MMDDTVGKVQRATFVNKELDRITSANSAARSRSRDAPEPK